MKKILLLLGFSAAFSNVSNAQILSRIEQFGDTMYSAGSASKIKTIVNGGILVAAYCDNSVGGKLTVSEKDFTQGWILYGTAGFSTGAPTSLDLTVDWAGDPIVAYTDPLYSGKVIVQKWNGLGWSAIGNSSGVSSANAQDVSVCFNFSTGFPSIAFKDQTTGGKITVMSWNGSAWNVDGVAGFSTGTVGYVNIQFSPALTHNVVAFKDSSDLKAHTMYFNGGSWNYLTGGNAFTTGEIASLDMEIDSVSKYPLYAVSEFNGSQFKASVYQHTGSSTVALGSTLFSPGKAEMVNIASDNTGMFLVSFRDGTLGNKATVMFNNGTGWNIVPGLFPTGPIGSCDVAIEGCGEFFVTYTDSSYQSQANSRRISFPLAAPVISPGGIAPLCFGGSTTLNSPVQPYANYEWLDSLRWDTVGIPTAFTGGSNNTLSYACEDYSAQKFVAIEDQTQGGKLVCYWHGGSGAWTQLGAVISTSTISSACLKITPNHKPVIAFSDDANASKLSVVIYNGSWVNIGPPGFSAGFVGQISMDITQGNKPVVAFNDGGFANKLTVMYFNGTNWIALGGQGISPGTIQDPCVKISPLGEIYVSYADYTNGGKANVIKWTGSAWATVGTLGFTGDAADGSKIDFDGQGNIYMSYKDGNLSGQLSLMKYNLSTWSTLSTGFTPPTATVNKLNIDNSNNIYVSYMTNPANIPTIIKYNGTGWDTVIHKPLSTGPCQIFDVCLESKYGVPPSAVISSNAIGNKLVGLQFNYSYAGSFSNSQAATLPGNYMLHTYKCNYTGTLSANDVVLQPAITPTVSAYATNDTTCMGLQDTLVANGANTYTWFNAAVNDSAFIIAPATATYSVVGTALNGCKDTAYVTVTIPTNGFTGIISDLGGPVTTGNIYLLHEKSLPGTFDTTAVRNIGAGGLYSIDTIANGNYLIKAIADTILYPTDISTYNGNIGVWDSAVVISHTCLKRDTSDIQLLQEYIPTGPGLIGGYVYEGAGFGLRLSQGPGNPNPFTNTIPGVPVKVGKNPGGNIVGGTYTDNNGFYQFDSLPCDSYYVYTDIPGYPMDTLYKVTISCTGGLDTILNLDYFVDSNSVYIDLTTGIHQNNSIAESASFVVFPNPSNGILTVKQFFAEAGEVNISVSDFSGKEIVRKSLQASGNTTAVYPLDITSAGKGIYLLRVTHHSKISISKIIIQ